MVAKLILGIFLSYLSARVIDKYKYFYPVSDVCCLVSILVEVFDKVVHTPLPGETEAYIPSEFINARFGDTSCLGDCTETTILPSENFM